MKRLRECVYLYFLVYSHVSTTKPPFTIDESLVKELESFSENEELMSKCRDYLPKQDASLPEEGFASSKVSKVERVFPLIALFVAGIAKASAMAANAAAIAAATAKLAAAAAAAKAAAIAAAAKTAVLTNAGLAAEAVKSAVLTKAGLAAEAVKSAVLTKTGLAAEVAKSAAYESLSYVAQKSGLTAEYYSYKAKAKKKAFKIALRLGGGLVLLNAVGVGIGIGIHEAIKHEAVKGREKHQDLKQRCLRMFSIVAKINRMTIEDAKNDEISLL